MSSVIEVPDELARILRENATAQGKDLNSYAVALLSKVALQDAAESASKSARRGKPIAQFIEEQREKHGFPADWGTGTTAPLSDEEWAEIDTAFAEIYPDGPDTHSK